MRVEPRSIVVSGDITAEVAAQAKAMLHASSEVSVDVEVGEVESSAGLIPTAEVLSIASCLAGVLSFLFTTWTAWRDRHDQAEVGALSPEERAQALGEQLRAFRAEGYEVESIQIAEDIARPGKGSATIVLRDVPSRQLIVVDATGDDRVDITRRPATAH